jgi:hypothetical protein
MATQHIKVDKLMDMIKEYDFSYLIQEDLEKWKKGVNKEYIIKSLIHDVLEQYGFENWKKLEIALIKATPLYLTHDIELRTIAGWFLPYNKPKESKHTPSEYKLKNHQSLKSGDTDKMS